MTNVAACPYCRGIPGVGDRLVKAPAKAFDQILAIGPGVVLTPTVGMLVPGYCLVVSTRHVLSYAEHDLASLDAVEEFVGKAIDHLSTEFGEYVVFEHGPSRTEAASHGACIAHAHLHLLPRGEFIRENLISALRWEPLRQLRELHSLNGRPYALCRIGGQFYVTEDSTPAPQWIRRKVVEWLGLNVDWNWASYAGDSELASTLALLRVPFARRQSTPNADAR